MLKTHMAACLVATALMAAPALAQTPAPVGSPPAASPASGAMAAVTATEFVTQAANSNMFEIQSSQLALDKAQDNRIRDFAQSMIKDHTAASDKLKAAAQNQTVPTTLDQEHTRMLQQLQQASGNDFNRSYVQMQFDGHQKAVALFEAYGQNGDDPQLKQFAQQTVPTLREHLQHVTDIRSSQLNQPPQVSQSQSGQISGSSMTQMQPGQWRASKLDGLNVYNNNNEKIGDISELLVDESGKIRAVVVGVGGFLGMGEHDVAIPFDQVKFANEPRANTTAANTTTGTTGAGSGTTTTTAPNTTGSSPTGATASSNGTMNNGVPDHALVNMTKDQLKAAPEFKYNR